MDGSSGSKRISRSLQFKRKKDAYSDSPKISLERVLGLTANTNAMLAVDPVNGVIAYPAGCIIVLHKKNKQDQICNSSKKTITSMAFSGDGKFLATGECGHLPAVRVFNVEDKVQVAEFHGHRFGIACVAFSPNQKYIISIGTQHDMMVNVWNWRSEVKAASNKVSCKVNAIDFSEGGSMFVTVGNRHVKFWYLDASQSEIRNETVPLLGRSGILAEQKNNNFVDVVCGRGLCASSTYVVTQSGLLCEFNVKRLLEKLVELRTSRAYALAGGDDFLFIGCADGIIRSFHTKTLQFVVTLPKPHPLGIDIVSGSSATSQKAESRYPDVVAIGYNQEKHELVSINSDHSLYIWDVRDLRRVGKMASFLYHSGCVWGIEVYPVCESEVFSMLPPGSFVTCSSDDTIRVWNLDPHWHASNEAGTKRNIYSTELLKIVYTDPNLSCLCEQDSNPAGSIDKTDVASSEMLRTGVRCVSISPDGQHLASGDRSGNLRVHDLQFMDEITAIEAHDSEILCLEFSNYSSGYKLLCSASRDRLIHIFNVDEGYALQQTLDDHSASIMSVKLTWSVADQTMWMLSCGADKSILFRAAECAASSGTDGGSKDSFQFSLRHHLVSKSTLHDMIVDPSQKFSVTACQDRNIRIYNMETGKQKKAYKASIGDDGTLLKVARDRTGTYLAASCSDKTTTVLEFFTGEIVGTMFGHSEVGTGMRFSNDLKHVITISADGCIFIWRLHPELTHRMLARLIDSGAAQPPRVQDSVATGSTTLAKTATLPDIADSNGSRPHARPSAIFGAHIGLTPVREDIDAEEGDEFEDEATSPLIDYRFSLGQLPSWAKKQLTVDETGTEVDMAASHQDDAVAGGSAVDVGGLAKGRWAQRLGEGQSEAPVQPLLTAQRPTEQQEGSLVEQGDTASRGRSMEASAASNDTLMHRVYDDDEEDDLHDIPNSEIIYYPTEEANRENDGEFKVFEAKGRDEDRDNTSDNASVRTFESEEEELMQQFEQLEEEQCEEHSVHPHPREDSLLTSASAVPLAVMPEAHNREQEHQFRTTHANGLDIQNGGCTPSGTATVHGLESHDDRNSLSARFLNNVQLSQLRSSVSLPQTSRYDMTNGSSPAAQLQQSRPSGSEGKACGSASVEAAASCKVAAGSIESGGKNQNINDVFKKPAQQLPPPRQNVRLADARRSKSRESLLSSADSLQSIPSLGDEDRTETLQHQHLQRRSQSTKDLTSWRKGPVSATAQSTGGSTSRLGEAAYDSKSHHGEHMKSSVPAVSGHASASPRHGTLNAGEILAKGSSNLSGGVAGGRSQGQAKQAAEPAKYAVPGNSPDNTQFKRGSKPKDDSGKKYSNQPPPTSVMTVDASIRSPTSATGHSSKVAVDVQRFQANVDGAAGALRSAVVRVIHLRDQLVNASQNDSNTKNRGEGEDIGKELTTLDEAVREAVDSLSRLVGRQPAADVVEPLLQHYSDCLVAMVTAKLCAVDDHGT